MSARREGKKHTGTVLKDRSREKGKIKDIVAGVYYLIAKLLKVELCDRYFSLV